MLENVLDFIRQVPGVYHLRRARYKRLFFSGRTRMWGLWGNYPSMDEARAQFADRARTTYDNDRVVEINVDRFSQVWLFDYAVMFWMSRLLAGKSGARLVDYGGHVGVKYYAYKKYLCFPDGFEWQVVDVPAMVRRGREKAIEEGASQQLRFFSDIADAQEAHVLFCSGSLQYSDLRIDEVVGRMKRKPQHIVISKLAVLEDSEVVTLENFAVSWIPYRIQNLKRFKASLAAIGYELVDEWEVTDPYNVPFVETAAAIMNLGQVWRLKHAPATGAV